MARQRSEVRGFPPHVISIITPQETTGCEGNLDLTELKYGCDKAFRDQKQHYVILIALLLDSVKYPNHKEGSHILITALQHHHLVDALIQHVQIFNTH